MILIIIIGIITFLLSSFLFKRFQRYRNMPVGPFAFPILGNMPAITMSSTPFYELVKQWGAKYGDPVTVWMGWKPIVVVSDYETVREMFIDNQHDFASRPRMAIGDIFMQDSEDIIFAPYNKLWQLQKKLATRAMRKIVDNEALSEQATEAVDQIVELFLKDAKGEAIDMEPYAMKAVHSVISFLCFGKKYSFDDPEFTEYYRQFQLFMKNVDSVQYLEAVPYASNEVVLSKFNVGKIVLDFRDFITTLCRSQYLSHKAKYNPDQVNDILDALIKSKNEMDEEGENVQMTEKNVILMILDMFIAGVETSTMAIWWFVLHMIRSPTLQEECYSLIKKVCGDNPPRLQDRADLQLIEACILEVLRLNPPAPFGVPHGGVNEMTPFRDTIIPKDASIMINIYAIHREKKWWKNPNEFDPKTNMYDEDGQFFKPSQFIPFGVGRRICLGEQLAKNDLFLICTRLLQRVKMVAPEGVTYSDQPFGSGFSMLPQKYTVKLIPRND